MKNKKEFAELTDEQLKEVTGGTGHILDEIQAKEVDVAKAGTEALDKKATAIVEQGKMMAPVDVAIK